MKSKKEFILDGAIMYLVQHSVYDNEWTGVGMWEAVVDVVRITNKHKTITEFQLNNLLKIAEDR